MSLATLEFEIPRRVVLLKKNTRMPDLTQLGVTGDPNVLDPVRVLDYNTGEFLLANSPPMTMYLDVDSDTLWRRTIAKTWVVWGDGGTTSTYNPYNEYTLASVSPDETLHFEDGSLFKTEDGEAIVFETYREADENAYAGSEDSQFFLEGMIPLITETGEAIHMETSDGRNNNLANHFSGRTIEGWVARYRILGGTVETATAFGDCLRDPYVMIRGGQKDRYISVTKSRAFVYINNLQAGFTIRNDGVQPWGDDNRTHVIFDHEVVVQLRHPAVGYSFRPSDDPVGYTCTNLTTGGSFNVPFD